MNSDFNAGPPNQRPQRTLVPPTRPPASPNPQPERMNVPLPRPVETDSLQEQPPKKPSSRKRFIKRLTLVLLGMALLATAALAAMFFWYTTQLSAIEPGSDEKVKVTIRQGMGPSDIATSLQEAGVIRSDAAFGWYVRLNGVSGALQSGTYRLGKSEDVPAIVKHLTSGKTDTFNITFLPGNTLAKHRQTLIDSGYDAATVDAALNKSYESPIFDGKPASADLEGYIYGETYQFASSATPEQILERTFEEFEAAINKNDLTKRFERRGFSLYEGITLASIIQREVITTDDMAQVSQIFQLRLKRDIQLGSDVTYQYIADKTGVQRDVNLDSPYNTRRYGGLPPGPIASPGIDAMISVAAPAKGDYLYFLSGDDDKTYYGRTDAEHEANIRNHCQKKCQII